MQELWEKTKDAAVFGLEAAKDISGIEKVSDDPEFEQLVLRVTDFGHQLKATKKVLERFIENSAKTVAASEELGEILQRELCIEQDQEKATTEQEIAALRNNIRDVAIGRIDNLLERVEKLDDLYERRYKQLLLTKRLQKKCDETTNPDPDLVSSMHKRSQKLHELTLRYTSLAEEFLASKNTEFKALMESYNSDVQGIIKSLTRSQSSEFNVATA